MSCWDISQLSLWQAFNETSGHFPVENRVFLTRLQDIFQPSLWQLNVWVMLQPWFYACEWETNEKQEFVLMPFAVSRPHPLNKAISTQPSLNLTAMTGCGTSGLRYCTCTVCTVYYIRLYNFLLFSSPLGTTVLANIKIASYIRFIDEEFARNGRV